MLLPLTSFSLTGEGERFREASPAGLGANRSMKGEWRLLGLKGELPNELLSSKVQ